MKKNHEIEISIALVKAEDLPKTPTTVSVEHKNRIVEACFESEEMIEYYKEHELDDHNLCDLICGAPISLEKKAELMEPCKDNIYFTEMYEQTVAAMDELDLDDDEIFILSEYNYWDRIGYKMLKYKNIFSSAETFEDYMQYIIVNRNNSDEVNDSWYELEKWYLDEIGMGERLYTYQFLEGEPVYFTKHGKPGNGFFRNDLSPYISLPFEKGDIVTVDCYPFAPITNVIFLEDGFDKNGWNKCHARILYKKQDGSWIDGLSLQSLWSPNHPKLSSLYRLRRYDGELGEDEDFIRKVQSFVRANGKNGENLSLKLYMTHHLKLYNDGASKEKVLEYMKEIEFENEHGKRGVFWVVDGELLAYPFDGRIHEAIAKSGNTYNHKLLWEAKKPCNKPFDYYPRGRVDINSKGEAVIYMNPNISEEYIPKIKTAFGITSEPVIKYDNSEHYKCFLDK